MCSGCGHNDHTDLDVIIKGNAQFDFLETLPIPNEMLPPNMSHMDCHVCFVQLTKDILTYAKGDLCILVLMIDVVRCECHGNPTGLAFDSIVIRKWPTRKADEAKAHWVEVGKMEGMYL
jgi:hypothetical protein